ncbi:unnamed protein product [Gongylonema pulchrum]|uniref:Transposase n=1 Tax=Gongylonema pulchrum TaxID=637853 RepID=A0A183DF61_9BILA|nr:unnamed protein product [Gongylonema pulchrum]
MIVDAIVLVLTETLATSKGNADVFRELQARNVTIVWTDSGVYI